MNESQQTALYRHYSEEGELLYVGISKNAPARLAEHMRGAKWRKSIAKVDVMHLPTREEALRAERMAIQYEAPLWNQVHSAQGGDNRRPAPSYSGAGHPEFTISAAANLYGNARSTIHRAIAAGRLSCTVRGDGVRVIQLAELIRLWGEPDESLPASAPEASHDEQSELLGVLHSMHRELKALREEVESLKTIRLSQ